MKSLDGTTSPRTTVADGRRSAIVETAADLIQERGYHSNSMEEIAESVGLRKPTLYHYFKSKDEILFEIHNEMIDLILARQDARLSQDSTSRALLLNALMKDIIELMESHPAHLRTFFEHHRELPDRYRQIISEKGMRFRGHLMASLEDGIAAEEFRDVDVELVALAVLGMCNWTYQWLDAGGERSTTDVTEGFWRIVMSGISLAQNDAPRTR